MDKGKLTRRYLARLGAILTNFGIVGLAYALAGIFSGFLLVFYLLFLVTITICTLFTVLVIPEFREMWSNIDKMGDFIAGIYNSLAYVIPISLVLLAIALVLMLFDRDWEKSKPRIILNIVVLSLLAVMFVFFIVGLVGNSTGGAQ